jgi:hypothetical protein
MSDDLHPDTDLRAQQAFDRARYKSFLRRVRAAIFGRSAKLLPFDQVREALRVGGPIYRGVRAVPLERIIGSVGRYRDFDNIFLPVQDATQSRWKSISRAFYEEVNLPPVTLYQVGDAYCARRQPLRVGGARKGQAYIDAEVMEVQVRVPSGPTCSWRISRSWASASTSLDARAWTCCARKPICASPPPAATRACSNTSPCIATISARIGSAR